MKEFYSAMFFMGNMLNQLHLRSAGFTQTVFKKEVTRVLLTAIVSLALGLPGGFVIHIFLEAG